MPINFFQALGSLTSLKSQTRDPDLKSLPENICSGFLRPEKIHRPQLGLNPRTFDLEASTLHRDHRDRPVPTIFSLSGDGTSAASRSTSAKISCLKPRSDDSRLQNHCYLVRFHVLSQLMKLHTPYYTGCDLRRNMRCG
jgi:hypothetical protein